MSVNEKVLLAGFGGQGILAAGKILAESGVEAGLNASWMPSYGPEMRGGTCNCQVVVSDGKITSPIFTRPGFAIIMNQASLARFAAKLNRAKPVIINSGLVSLDDLDSESRKNPDQARVVEIDATGIAQRLGSVKCANMVILGAYVKHSGSMKLEMLKNSIAHIFAGKGEAVQLNNKALEEGYALA